MSVKRVNIILKNTKKIVKNNKIVLTVYNHEGKFSIKYVCVNIGYIFQNSESYCKNGHIINKKFSGFVVKKIKCDLPPYRRKCIFHMFIDEKYMFELGNYTSYIEDFNEKCEKLSRRLFL